ncbi:LOW QUALITY PROTEIN: hypothetical protein HID58_049684, partial [Brassica napus]
DDNHPLVDIASAATVAWNTRTSSNTLQDPKHINVGLKYILNGASKILAAKLCNAADNIANGVVCRKKTLNTMRMDENLLKIVRKYGERIMLKESDLLPRISKKKTRRRDKHLVCSMDWQGPPPWDSSLGGDGCPKFLLDVMVEGLAKHVRCVGIDAAVPPSKKPDSRELLDQALKENIWNSCGYNLRVTTETIMLNRDFPAKDQRESIDVKMHEMQWEAAKGFQRISNCLVNKKMEFWQCMNCHQLYWEGTQYHNAVQKFMDSFILLSLGLGSLVMSEQTRCVL